MIHDAALEAFAENLGIKKRIGLDPDHQRVSDDARLALASDPQGYIDAYWRTFGNVFNADDAAELFGEYSRCHENRSRYHSAIHECTRWLRDKAFEQALTKPGSPDNVVFMSGGSAVGKSTVAPAIAREFRVLVYDTTLSVLSGSRRSIQQVLDAGKYVTIIHITRDLEESFRANLKRATCPIVGAGRVTSVLAMIRTHKGADETAIALNEEFREHPSVSFGRETTSRLTKLPGAELTEVMQSAIAKYGSKPEALVTSFPQYDRRVNRAYIPQQTSL